jgi:hypothetical protein
VPLFYKVERLNNEELAARMKRLVSPTLNPAGLMAATGTVYAATVMILNPDRGSTELQSVWASAASADYAIRLNDIRDPVALMKHPGLFRSRGHIGFLGHNDYIEFRNIRIQELPAEEKENSPPEGFTALFNGTDLTGWKGLLAPPNDNPAKRAKLAPEKFAEEQAKADARMRDHWKAESGEVVFDGKGDSLCTKKDYTDFEMLVDWKIPPKGDSGIYVRGSPQVQIWEPHSPGQFNPTDGSGGLYNNEKNPRHPLKSADKPVGEWNRFRIIMVDDKVHVFLNGELVVRATTLENYWERDKPIYPSGQIELQNHGGPLWFKNIYVREITHAQTAGIYLPDAAGK